MQKKGVKSDEDKDTRISSMLVGTRNQGEDQQEGGESEVEDDLYNLMRGHSVLMIAADSDESENESEEDSDEEGQFNEGSSSISTEGKSPGAALEVTSSVLCLSTSSASPQWGSLQTKPPKWGNNPMPDSRDEEWANEWRERGRTLKRRARDQEISRGGSPPPKLEDDNLFTEGSSRKSIKPFYREKEDITDVVWESRQKKEERNTPPSKQLRRLPDCYILN